MLSNPLVSHSSPINVYIRGSTKRPWPDLRRHMRSFAKRSRSRITNTRLLVHCWAARGHLERSIYCGRYLDYRIWRSQWALMRPRVDGEFYSLFEGELDPCFQRCAIVSWIGLWLQYIPQILAEKMCKAFNLCISSFLPPSVFLY